MRKLLLLSVFIIAVFSFAFAQTPTLGTYPATTVATAGGTATVTPSTTPTNAASATAYTSTNFKGVLQVNPITGLVTVTNAYPAGSYIVTIKAFNGTVAVSTTFQLTVGNSVCGNLTATSTIPLAADAYSIAVGDFNGDGKQDMAIPLTTSGTATVAIRLGNGMGGFTGTTNVAVGVSPRSVAIGDFNGDGKQDMAVANQMGNTISIRLGDGAGNFSGTTNINIGNFTYFVVTADFNRDGKSDLACVSGADKIAIRLGDGAGNFSGSTEVQVSSFPNFLAVGDFNNDDYPDFVTANRNSNSVSIVLGDGAGNFSAATNLPVGSLPQAVAVSDFNGDNHADLLVVNNGDNNVAILLGDGTGSFSGVTNVPVGPAPRAIVVNDFNGDGKQDFITANSSPTYSIRMGNGAGGFVGTANPALVSTPQTLATGDFNNDGRPDIAIRVFSSSNYTVAIYTGSTTETEVQGNGITIPDGDRAPGAGNHTTYDNTNTITRTYTIRNTGLVNMYVSGISMSGMDSAMFVPGGITFPVTVAPGAFTTFTLSFIPTNSGIRTAVVNILNDDCDEANYDFAVQGTAVVPVQGTYTDTNFVALGGNKAVAASSAPVNTAAITAYTSPLFKGLLHVNRQSGLVSVTNAHPAGTYTITVKAFNGSASSKETFVLQVGSTACSQALFSGNNSIAGGSNMRSIVAGDINNDGNQDLMATSYTGNYVLIRLGDSTGNFSAGTNVNVGTGPQTVVIADFNTDGNSDFATANYTGNNVSIRLGDGTGSFTTAADVSTGSGPFAMAIADFNGDGNPDFAVTNYLSNTVSIRLGDGIGGFTNGITLTAGAGPRSIAAADFNDDGKQDLVVANYSAGNLFVTLGDGNGGFGNSTTISVGTGLQFTDAITTGDFNSDGKTDFVCSYQGNTVTNSYGLSEKIGNGTGGFTTPGQPGVSNPSVIGAPQAIVTGDFNNDGEQDLAVVNNSNVNVNIILGVPTSITTNFTAGVVTSAGSPSSGIAVGDFNKDGIQDFAAANLSGNISIRFGGANRISLSGNNNLIANGDTIPSVTDSTDFGSNTANSSRTYIIRNSSPVPLTISNVALSGADASSYFLNSITYPVNLAANAADTFTVTFAPGSAGIKKATVYVSSNNCDMANFRFDVQGTATAISLSLSYPSATVVTGGNITVAPYVPPGVAATITAATNSRFKGILQVNPVTGTVIVTNAYPAGVYTIKVSAFTFSTSFTITVNDAVCSQGKFAGTTNQTISGSTLSMAIGDFNSDVKQDIITESGGTATVRLGNGTGGFGTATNVSSAGNGTAIAVGDFNSDGKPDFVVNGFGLVYIKLGNGTGGFSGTATVPVGTYPQFIALADFNGDGRQDLATVNNTSNSVSIRLGDGGGGFSGNTDIAVGTNPYALATGDVNNDGKNDFIVTNYDNRNVSICYGDGLGGFSDTTNINVGIGPNSVATGDFNSDGNLDFAVSNYSDSSVSIRLGDGAGNFTHADSVRVGRFPRNIVTGDFNGDGKVDFAASSNFGVGQINVRLGDGMGGFTAGATIPTAINPGSLLVADLNADGRQDLISLNTQTSSTSLSVRLGMDKEINIQGNNLSIADGTNLPDTASHSDFGKVPTGGSLIRTFTLQNTGIDTLTISSINLTGEDSLLFTVGGITLPATIPAGTSKTFTITFTPTGNGIKTTRVTIYNDDCDESIYDFAIRGTAACSPSSTANVWLGVTSDWNLSSNWSLNFVPSECTKVVVNAGVSFMPEITSATSSCYSLTLNNGAIVIVKSNGRLNITSNN